MKFENVEISNFEGAFRGMRNPKESWHLSDSTYGIGNYSNLDENAMGENCDKVINSWIEQSLKLIDENPNERLKPDKEELEEKKAVLFEKYFKYLNDNGIIKLDKTGIDEYCEYAFIGPRDMDLAKRLIKGGTEHRKFLRQIQVSVDITAPLYVWKEIDTYKVATTANSTSTMHKILSAPITLERFELDDYNPSLIVNGKQLEPKVKEFIDFLEELRILYIKTNNVKYWKELIRWLPEGWLYKRTLTCNYEILRQMVRQRKGHKLTEWAQILDFISTLPYADDLIFY